MSAPARQRPGTQTVLTPRIESINTGNDRPDTAAPPTGEEPNEPIVTGSLPQTVSTAPSSDEETLDRTFKIRKSNVKRAETAVLRRAGGYTSMRAFIDGAIEHELARLAESDNGGVPFEPNGDAFTRGRPLGS